MEIISTGKRGFALRFDEVEDWITNLYLCFASNRTYLVDTYCGPDMISEVKDFIREQAPGKPLVVINTHYHWDHVWGNCAFPENTIISHALCREEIERNWDIQIRDNQVHQMGKVLKHLPTQVFTDQLSFPDDHVELRHTPGHTGDSITFFDHMEKVAFAGDNIEHPIPYVESADLDRFIRTFRQYLHLSDYQLISSHSESCGPDLVMRNIQYLSKLRDKEPQFFLDPYVSRVHQMNLQFLRDASQSHP